MTEGNIIAMIRRSPFPKQSALFLKVIRIAYVDARIWESYQSRAGSNPMYKELQNDALIEMIDYLNKAISVLREIKNDADKLKGNLRLSMTGSDVQARISEALKHYVRIEKDWEVLTGLADSIERSGMAGQEKVVFGDLHNTFADISTHALVGINILKDVRSKAVDLVV